MGDEKTKKAKKMCFASYSDDYMAGIFTLEIVQCMKRRLYKQGKMEGKWMGLWQIASLANILQHRLIIA